jgi:hypothetical protein
MNKFTQLNVLYATSEKQAVLPKMLLDQERMKYELQIVAPTVMIHHTRMRVADGWCFQYRNDKACDWRELYRLLDKHGLLLC